MYQKKGLYIPYAKQVKEQVNVPILCAGRMDNPDLARRAILEKACDIVSLGRPLLAEPYYVNKLAKGDLASIRPCLSCQEGCMGRIQEYSALNCAVNPAACRERECQLIPAARKKKVFIAGGGVAGCEAARVLALRGHQPEVFEMSESLGGNLIPGGVPDFKEDDHALAAWYEHELKSLGVPVHYKFKATVENIIKADFDAVIVATGSTPKMIPVGEGCHVYPAAEVFMGKAQIGQKVVVIGGGLVGCETALWLAEQGKQVTIVEQMEELLAQNGPLCHANSDMLERLVPFKGIQVLTSAQVTHADHASVTVMCGNGEKNIPADSVILAVGYRQNRSLYDELKGRLPELYLLGDARKVANIMYAVWDAFEVASSI